MGMPQIPPAEHRPTFCQTRIDLLEAMALDSMSDAHILNAQGEQNQAVVQQFAAGTLNFCQLQQNCRCTRSLLQSLIMKQWLQQQKLAAIAELTDGSDNACVSPPVCDPCPPQSSPSQPCPPQHFCRPWQCPCAPHGPCCTFPE